MRRKMENLKKRKSDNGVRRIFNPSWIAVAILVLGYVFLLVSNVKTIPALTKLVHTNEHDITELKTNYEWIKFGIKEIKEILKER